MAEPAVPNDIPKDLPEAGEEIPTPEPQAPEVENPRSALVEVFRHNTADVQARHQRVLHLSTLLTGANQQSDSERAERQSPPMREFSGEIQQLKQDMERGISTEEYLIRSGKIEEDLELFLAAREDIVLDEDVELDRHDQDFIRTYYDEKLEDLQGNTRATRFLRKINPLDMDKRKQLRSRKKEFLKEATENARKETKQKYDSIKYTGYDVLRGRNDAFVEVLGQELSAIRGDYVNLATKIDTDLDFINSVRNAYVDITVKPDIDYEVSTGSITRKEADEILSQLHSIVTFENDAPDEHYREFNELSRKYSFLSYKRDIISVLRGNDRPVLRALVGDLGAGEFKQLQEALGENLNDYFQRYEPSQIRSLFDEAKFPHSSWDERDKIENLPFIVFRTSDQPPWEWQTDVLQSIRSTPEGKIMFGEQIEEIEQGIQEGIQKNSLEDNEGTYIQLLDKYPTPDSIRNLVLIAAADARSYRTVHANGVLERLARRTDWPAILDETIKEYPALENARELLLTWKIEGIMQHDYNHPGIQQATGKFVRFLLGNPETDKDVRKFAPEALSNKEYFDITIERGLLTPDEIRVFSDIQDFFAGSYNTGMASYSLEKGIRTACKNLPLFGDVREDDLRRNTDRVRVFSRFSRWLLENKPEVEAINTICTGSLISAMNNGSINPEIFSTLLEQGKRLMRTELREFVIQNGRILLQDESDIQFIDSLVGRFGTKADSVIRGYHACVTEGILSAGSKEDKQLLLDFSSEFRVISPAIIRAYKTSVKDGSEKIMLAELKSIGEKLIGGRVTDEERAKLYFRDLVQDIYPNNSGENWTNYENNDSCEDRSNDLEGFTIQPGYTIDLLSASDITIKSGESLDTNAIEGIKDVILAVSRDFDKLEYDPDKMLEDLEAKVDSSFQRVARSSSLGMDMGQISSLEEKLFLLLTESSYNGAIPPSDIKELFMRYEFAKFEDVREYIAGTSDRVSKAPNKEYALLCELDNFFSDRIKEVNRRLIEEAYENPAIQEGMRTYFEKVRTDTLSAEQQQKIARLQIDKLGISEGFLRQMKKTVKQATGKDYTPEQLRRFIHLYELTAGGLTEKVSINKKTKALYGQIKSQREKTLEAISALGGDLPTKEGFHLDKDQITGLIAAEASIVEGEYDENNFATYTLGRFYDLFSDERSVIEGELGKFQSASGKDREVLRAYITKTKESAHARMVGGVCVSGDNPLKNKEQNMWDMPNYFQLVLQDPDTYRCQGLVLLHHFTDPDGKRILTASFNPSSTYVYSVDEEALFRGLLGTLETFAVENKFDSIMVSQNAQIRTNRTGGGFEKAMDARITQIGKEHTFSEPQQFSYAPHYQLQQMDVVWEKAA